MNRVSKSTSTKDGFGCEKEAICFKKVFGDTTVDESRQFKY